MFADSHRETFGREGSVRHRVGDDERHAFAKHVQASTFATLSVFAPHHVHARVEERAVRVFAPNVRGALFGEETRLHVLGAHAVHHQPREHVSESSSRGSRGIRLRQSLEFGGSRRRGSTLPRGGGDGDELRHLRDDDELEALPSANLAHAPRALRVISQRHVFSERHRRHRRGRLTNVHAGGVHLIVKGKSLGRVQRGDARERGDGPSLAHEHHLAVALVEVDAPFRPR